MEAAFYLLDSCGVAHLVLFFVIDNFGPSDDENF
jgi:hypothetical protein